MPTTVACFCCGMSAVVALDGKPITIEYDHAEWEQKCTSTSGEGILLCPNMRGILRALAVPLEDGRQSIRRAAARR